MTRYSHCLEVDDGDDTQAPSMIEWKRGECAATLWLGLGMSWVGLAWEGRKRVEGGLLLPRAEKGREGGLSPSGIFIFHFLDLLCICFECI